jgi:hypothetical protein
MMHFIKSLIMSSSQTVVEDTAMMASTEPNFTTPLFGCNEGTVQFGSVTAKYPISGSADGGTVRLTSIHYRVSGNLNFCFAPTETIDGQVKKKKSHLWHGLMIIIG